MMTKYGSRLFDQVFVRSGPIRWLVVGGTLLIAAIAIGSVLMAQNFRERALRNSGRELENTVLLLAHHFDQQLQDFAVIQKDFVDHVRATGIASAEDYRKRLSGQDVHRMLRSKIEALPYMGGVNIIDAEGNLINSSTAWPAPKVNVADRAYFRTFKYDPDSPNVLIEPVHSRVSGAWTILIVRKIVGTERRVHGRGRTRHRTGQFREVLRLRRARRRRYDLDAASRRHAARSLSPFQRADGHGISRPARSSSRGSSGSITSPAASRAPSTEKTG